MPSQAPMTLARMLIRCADGALLTIAAVSCSPAVVVSPPATAARTPAVASIVGQTSAPVDPNGPDGGVERAYRAFERGEVDAFLEAIDPAVRDMPGPMEFGNLVILDPMGLGREVSR